LKLIDSLPFYIRCKIYKHGNPKILMSKPCITGSGEPDVAAHGSILDLKAFYAREPV